MHSTRSRNFEELYYTSTYFPCLLTNLAPYTKSRALTRPPAPSAVTLCVMKQSLDRVLILLDSVRVVFHLARLSMSISLVSRVSGVMLTVAARSQILRPCSPTLLLMITSPSCFSTVHPSSSTIRIDFSK